MFKAVYNNFLRNFNDSFYAVVEDFFKPKLKPDIGKKLYLQAKEALLGGKRIRPFLIYLAANSKSKRLYLGTKILRLGYALESIHAALLVQDDIVDRSLLRRGKPTAYMFFRETLKDKLETKRLELVADNYAVLVSDLLFNFATVLLSSFPEKFANIVVSNINNTIVGQGLDILNTVGNLNLKYNVEILEDVIAVYKYKTAYYTFVLPLQLGYALLNKRLPSRMRLFAENLGIAYQIQDDIIGAFGSPKKTGKDNISDFKEGKNTILIAYVLTYGNDKAKNRLFELLGNKDLTEKQAEEIRGILINAGALDYANKLLEEHYNLALESLQKAPISSRVRQILTELAEWVIKREK